MNHPSSALWWLILLLSFAACKPEEASQTSNTLTVRIKGSVEGFNPVTSNKLSYIQKWIFPSLVNFDPESEKLAPVLIDSLPEKVTIDTGIYAGAPAYRFRFLDAAKWPNGSDITAKDYIFSLKVALNKGIKDNSLIRTYSPIIRDVLPAPKDNKSFIVVLQKEIINVTAYLGGFALLPAYHYDPKHLLDSFVLSDFVKDFEQLKKKHPAILEFAKDFNSEKYIRDPKEIVGAGPYRLARWDANEQLILVKKENFWADKLPQKSVYITGNPDTLIYKIVPDEVATSLMLKNEQLDLVADMREEQFVKLKSNPTIAEKYNFFTPSSPGYYLILLNNRSPKLTKPVRKALAQCISLDQINQVATAGLGTKVVGLLSPNSPYYDHDLKPIKQDIAQAKKRLQEEGWTDSDHDGILDKTIHGKKTPLILKLLSANSTGVGQVVSPVIKEAAAKIGIKIVIQGASLKQIIGGLRSHDYDMALVRFVTSPADYMPYGSWHSDNAGKNGRNFTGYSSSRTDSVITALQEAHTTAKKKELYRQFQENIYEDQPVIFLFSPTKTLVVHKRWEPVVSSVRPGYFEGGFRLKK